MEYITFGPVHLNVTNLNKSIEFWINVVGMQVRKEGNPTEIGTSERTLIMLHPDAETPYKKGYSSIYHLAIHLPSESELARLLLRLMKSGWKISPVDHIIAKSIYANDPDGISIEFAFETPERVRSYEIMEDGLKVIDNEGRLKSPVEALDVQSVLNHLTDYNTNHPFPNETIVGHMNLHVGNLQTAYDFYKKLGFT